MSLHAISKRHTRCTSQPAREKKNSEWIDTIPINDRDDKMSDDAWRYTTRWSRGRPPRYLRPAALAIVDRVVLYVQSLRLFCRYVYNHCETQEMIWDEWLRDVIGLRRGWERERESERERTEEMSARATHASLNSCIIIDIIVGNLYEYSVSSINQ